MTSRIVTIIIVIVVDTMNISKQSGDKELFSGMLVKENTMNISNRSGDKELFFGTIVEENIIETKINYKKYNIKSSKPIPIPISYENNFNFYIKNNNIF